MTTAISINLMIRLPVADAPECVSWPEGLTHVPTEVVWNAAYHHGRVWPVRAMAISGAFTTHYNDAIPDWVPRPPDGWDSSVTDHARTSGDGKPDAWPDGSVAQRHLGSDRRA